MTLQRSQRALTGRNVDVDDNGGGADDIHGDDDYDDIYIMMQCLYVTKNKHFPLSS